MKDKTQNHRKIKISRKRTEERGTITERRMIEEMIESPTEGMTTERTEETEIDRQQSV